MSSNPIQPIQMVVSDVDGTLVDPQKDLTERAQEVVRQLRQSGLKFTLISSRPPYGLHSLSNTLELNQPLAAFNGGLFASPEGAILQQHFIATDLIEPILQQLQRFHLSPRLYTDERWFIPSLQQPHTLQEICTIETEPTVSNDFKPYYGQLLKITGVSNDIVAVEQCQKALSNQLGSKASVLCSQAYYLDITHPLANKGTALMYLAQLENIPLEQVAVIGDMPSDVPMFKQAGISIAMGNASDAVKNQANFVTTANDKDGFAHAMEQYILGKAQQTVSAR